MEMVGLVGYGHDVGVHMHKISRLGGIKKAIDKSQV